MPVTPPGTISTSTAIGWPLLWGLCASTFGASMRRKGKPCVTPRPAASPFNSQIFYATSARITTADASISLKKTCGAFVFLKPILKSDLSDAFQALMRFEVERARHYYTEAKKLLPFLSKEAQPTFAIMYRIYRGILDEIERNNYDVFSHRARVSTLKKVQYVLEAWVRQHRALELKEKE